jgi:hypothetical protein
LEAGIAREPPTPALQPTQAIGAYSEEEESMTIAEYGFVTAGEWTLRPTVKSGITFKLTAFASSRVVYAFVVDDQPKYIGICEKDTTTLQDRMSRYKNQQGGGTNKRISIKIRQALSAGKAVYIFALQPDIKFDYKDLEIDTVKGLENHLIARFKPEWNR